jgi:hypothetical protein
MDEKKIIVMSESIVNAIVDISMGRSKFSLTNTVLKKLSNNPEIFERVRDCYIEYLGTIDSKIDETMEVKKLSDFRYKIVDVYENATKE